MQKISKPERLFLLFGWGPWVLLAAIFRVIFLIEQSTLGVPQIVDTVRLFVGVYGTLGLLGWLLIRALGHVGSIRWRTGLVLASQSLLLFVSFMEMASFNFWKVTGTQLDYFLIQYTLQDIKGVFHLVSESTPWYLFVIFGVFCLLMLATPVWLYRRDGQSLQRDRVPAKLWVALLVLLFGPCWPLLSKSYSFATVSPTPLYLVTSFYDFKEQAVADANAPVLKQLTIKHDLKKVSEPKNIVFVILESTRAFSVNPYQNKHNVTPFLESLTKKAIWAEQAYAIVPHTSKALVSILCGVEPHLGMPIREAKKNNMPAECLAKLLRSKGYETGYFQSATQRFEGRRGLVQNMGYKDFYPSERLNKKGFERANYFGQEDAIMLKPSMKWVDRVKKKPFFLTYLTLTPHHQYLAPRKRYGFEEFVKDDEMNRYLNTVRYVDQFSKDVVEGLKKRGEYKNTIFVFVGDHGEGFNEHERSQHDNVIYEEGLRIPLIIYDPSKPKAQRITTPVNQLDIIPTVLSMAGWAIRPEQWRGRDIRKVKQTRPMFAHCWYERRCMAVIKGKKKYIHHFGKQPDEHFLLDKDPLEKQSKLAVDQKQQLTEMNQWRQSVLNSYQQYYKGKAQSNILTTPPERIQHRLNITYNQWVTFLGYDISPAKGPYKPGQKIKVTSYFHTHQSIPQGWRIFMHSTTPKGHMVKNLDHRMLGGLYTENQWKPGQYLVDHHTFTVPRKFKGKQLHLRAGMWHKKRGKAKYAAPTSFEKDNRGRLIVGKLKF